MHATLRNLQPTDSKALLSCPLYQVQSFAFDLLNGAKQWVLTALRARVDELAEGHPLAATGSEAFDNLLMSGIHDIWPSPPLPVFCVPIPRQQRLAVTGAAEAKVDVMWRLLRTTGLFTRVKKASAFAHRAERFLVPLDFGYASTGEDCAVSSLGLGLTIALAPCQFRSLYSRHYRDKILHDAVTELHGLDPTLSMAAHEESLRGLLIRGWCVDCADASPASQVA
jgi:hypothetical protein